MKTKLFMGVLVLAISGSCFAEDCEKGTGEIGSVTLPAPSNPCGDELVLAYVGKGSNAEIIASVLNSDKTPAEARELLSAVIDGQPWERRVSIMKVDTEVALGALYATIRVGIDILHEGDPDSGFNTEKEIQARYQKNEAGLYELKEVKLTGAAG